VQQVFANVYFYSAPTIALVDGAGQNAMIDEIVAKEKEIHSINVGFLRARLWNTQSGSQSGNQMRVDKALTGVGQRTNRGDMDRERAVLVQVEAGVNSRGRPVFLSKYWHTCAEPAAITLATTVLENTAGLSQAARDYWAGKFNDLLSLEIAGQSIATLTSQTMRTITGAARCHPFLEHHQLGDKWRG